MKASVEYIRDKTIKTINVTNFKVTTEYVMREREREKNKKERKRECWKE